MVEVEREYPYRAKLGSILLGAGLFGGAAYYFSELARTNDQGLILNGILRLPPAGATAFYWLLCFLSAGFVAMAVAGLVRRYKVRQRIAFTAAGILVPVSPWSAEEQSIDYGTVVELKVQELNRQRLLQIVHGGGTAHINSILLPSRKAFDEVCDILTERVRSARQQD